MYVLVLHIALLTDHVLKSRIYPHIPLDQLIVKQLEQGMLALGVPGHVQQSSGDIADHQFAVCDGHLASQRQSVPDETRPPPAAPAAGDTPSTGKCVQRLWRLVFSDINAGIFKTK